MKNTTDEIDSCPAPQRLWNQAPDKPPNQPADVCGPLAHQSVFGQFDGRDDELQRLWTDGRTAVSALPPERRRGLRSEAACRPGVGCPSHPHCDFRTQRLAVVVIARSSLPPLSPPVVAPCFGRRQMFGYRGPHDRYPTSSTRCSPLISPGYLKEPGSYSTRRVPRLGIFGTGLGAFARTASSKVRP